MTAAKNRDDSPNFEDTLAQLESLVEKMEQGDISLQDSMTAFEQGISLTRKAQKDLAEAEQKVQLLLASEDEPVAAPFHEGEDES